MKDAKVIEAMRVFSEMMFTLYQDAEGLRDCTEDGGEKEIFNETRNALYNLKYKARALYYKWADESKKKVAGDGMDIDWEGGV